MNPFFRIIRIFLMFQELIGMKKRLILTITTLIFSFSHYAATAANPTKGDIAAGKTKSAVCAACHGADGNSINPTWPKLAGQHPDYLLKQLQDFKSGTRKDPTMAGMVAALSDQDMKNLAAYYSSQKSQMGTAKDDQKKLALGERIYRGGNNGSGVSACTACHGPTGAGNPAAKFPKISGQHSTYTSKQLKSFSTSERTNDLNKMMQNIAQKMTDAEIAAVSEYIAGLKE